MKKSSKILVSFLAFIFVFSMGMYVLASDDAVDLMGGTPTNNITGNTVVNTTNNVTNDTNNIIANIIASTTNNTTNNAVNNTTSNLPNTGIDTTILFVVVAFGISAMYAYKKISDYRIG